MIDFQRDLEIGFVTNDIQMFATNDEESLGLYPKIAEIILLLENV